VHDKRHACHRGGQFLVNPAAIRILPPGLLPERPKKLTSQTPSVANRIALMIIRELPHFRTERALSVCPLWAGRSASAWSPYTLLSPGPRLERHDSRKIGHADVACARHDECPWLASGWSTICCVAPRGHTVVVYRHFACMNSLSCLALSIDLSDRLMRRFRRLLVIGSGAADRRIHGDPRTRSYVALFDTP